MNLEVETVQEGQQNGCCKNKTSCRMKCWAVVSLIVAIVGLIFVWIGTELLATLDSRSTAIVWGLVLFPCAAFALVPNILVFISVRSQNAYYGVTVTAICFSAIYILCDLAIGGFLLGLASDYVHYFGYAKNDRQMFSGHIVLSIGAYILSISQIICIIIASYETKRVVSSKTYTMITTDPMTGQQYSQIIQEKTPQASIPSLVRNSANLPSRRNKVGAIFSIVFTLIGICLMVVGGSVADDSAHYGIGLWLIIIYTFVIIWILISNIFLLISVYRTNTHHGFSVTALVFAILTTLGAIGVVVAFAFISELSKPHTYSYTYSHYSSYYGTYTSNYNNTYGSNGEHNGYGVVSFSGVMIAIGQILAIVFSSLEIRRIPPTVRNTTVMIPMAPIYSPQPQMFYNPPQIYPYPMEAFPPTYSPNTV